jgi:hypothetical protein
MDQLLHTATDREVVRAIAGPNCVTWNVQFAGFLVHTFGGTKRYSTGTGTFGEWWVRGLTLLTALRLLEILN